MSKKFFGSESSLQRQFIASGLTGVFALGAVGSSYSGAMEEEEGDLFLPQFDKDTTLTNPLASFFRKYKVPIFACGSILVLATIVIILFHTVIVPAFKPKKTDTEEQKEQGDAKTGEPSSTENQEKNKNQKPSDVQGEKEGNGINTGLVAGVTLSTLAAIGGGGAVIAKNMMNNENGEKLGSGYMCIKGNNVPKEDTTTEISEQNKLDQNLGVSGKTGDLGSGNEGGSLYSGCGFE